MPRIFRKGLGSIIIWTCYEFLIDKNDSPTIRNCGSLIVSEHARNNQDRLSDNPLN